MREEAGPTGCTQITEAFGGRRIRLGTEPPGHGGPWKTLSRKQHGQSCAGAVWAAGNRQEGIHSPANSQGRGAKWSPPLWHCGQPRSTLAQRATHCQKSGTSELLVPRGLCLPHTKGKCALWLRLLLQAFSCEIPGLAKSL